MINYLFMRVSFLLSFLLLHIGLNAQICDSRELNSFVEAVGGYPIAGTANLEKHIDGNLVLKIHSNFNTTAGPDLHIYLAILNAAPTAVGNTHYEVAKLSSNTGAQNYTIPNTVDFEAFDYVLIHCKQYNHFWGGGAMAEETGYCNTISSTEEVLMDKIWHFYPNPAKSHIRVELLNGGNLQIVNNLGQIVWTKKNVDPLEQIDLSSLNSGMYFLQYELEGKWSNKKLIIE